MSQTINHKTTKKYLTGCQGDPCYQLPKHEKKKKKRHHYSGLSVRCMYLRKGLPDNVLGRLDCGIDQESSNKYPYEVQILQLDF